MMKEARKFELQPILSGELVVLRPLRAEDFAAVYSVAADPLLWEQHPEPTRYQREVFQKFFAGAMESGGAFAVTDAATGEIIGSTRFYDHSPERREIFLGYTFLARKYWGGRHNPEMKRLLLMHAFQFVDSVIFQIGAGNRRSRTAIERIGAKLEFEGVKLGGNPHAIYRIEASNFIAP